MGSSKELGRGCGAQGRGHYNGACGSGTATPGQMEHCLVLTLLLISQMLAQTNATAIHTILLWASDRAGRRGW